MNTQIQKRGNRVKVEINKAFHNINDGEVWSICLPGEGFQAFNEGRTNRGTKTCWINFSKFNGSTQEYYYSCRYSENLREVIKNLPFSKKMHKERIEYVVRCIREGVSQIVSVDHHKFFAAFYKNMSLGEEKLQVAKFFRISDMKISLADMLEAWHIFNQTHECLIESYVILPVDIEELEKLCVDLSYRENSQIKQFAIDITSFYLRGAILQSYENKFERQLTGVKIIKN